MIFYFKQWKARQSPLTPLPAHGTFLQAGSPAQIHRSEKLAKSHQSRSGDFRRRERPFAKPFKTMHGSRNGRAETNFKRLALGMHNLALCKNRPVIPGGFCRRAFLILLLTAL